MIDNMLVKNNNLYNNLTSQFHVLSIEINITGLLNGLY